MLLLLMLRRVAALARRNRRPRVVAIDMLASRRRLRLSLFLRFVALTAVDAVQQIVVELATRRRIVVAGIGRRRGRTRVDTVVEQPPKRGICQQIATERRPR